MNNIIKRILQNKKLTLKEVNSFIESYVEHKTGKLPTTKEMQAILAFIQQGIFNLHYAALEYAKDLEMQVIFVQDIASRKILRTDIYEKVENTSG